MRQIDVNCDLGEGFGVYRAAPEEEIFPLVTSANIACGLHAGDPLTILHSLELAVEHHVAVGAHPGTPDLVGFGRRRMELSRSELESLLLYQIGAVEAIARAHGTVLSHVKPHGWLYNEAARNLEMARTIARTVKKVSPLLVLFGLSGSLSIQAAEEEGLPYAREAFIDRSYLADGSLVPRSQTGALITDPRIAATQALGLVLEGKISSLDGQELRVVADTLCVHGDNPEVVKILKEVLKVFREHQIERRPIQPC